MDPHRPHTRSSSTRSPAERSSHSPHVYTPPWVKIPGPLRTAVSTSPLPPLDTPPWFKRRENPPTQASPSPVPHEYPGLPPLDFYNAISVPAQAKHLTVVTPEEDPVPRAHIPRPKGVKSKSKPSAITVVPVPHPIALVTAHTPAPVSAMRRGPRSDAERTPRTPYTPEPSPYADPAVAGGLPRTLGLRAFPVRAEGSWRRGGE